MDELILQFKQSLEQSKSNDNKKEQGHYCAPRVKDPLLGRILKLVGKETPKTDQEFWAVAPKVNDFILKLIDRQVTELEKSQATQPAKK